MRITGGIARGRKLVSPKSGKAFIRPTSDRVREALFNIIGQHIVGRRVIDFFAGTGTLGIEALSRGADFVLFVDRSLEAGKLIESNLRTCFSRPHAAFVHMDLAGGDYGALKRFQASEPATFDVVLLDPPYERGLVPRVLEQIQTLNLLSPTPLVIVEEKFSMQLPEHCGQLLLTDQRHYGETGLWFYTSAP